jgi:hypothetical protein
LCFVSFGFLVLTSHLVWAVKLARK